MYTAAIGPRPSVSTPKSRHSARTSAMRLMQKMSSAAGVQQATHEASRVDLLDVVRSDKGSSDRGRIFRSPQQLALGLQCVQRKLRTSALRTDFHTDSSVLVDDEAEGEEDGTEWAEGLASGRVRGRRVVQTQGVGLPDEPGWQWEKPAGLKVGQLVGSLHLDAGGEPAWYDAILIEVSERQYNRGNGSRYRLFFPADGHDDWYTLPDDTVAYRAGYRATTAELRAAKAMCA